MLKNSEGNFATAIWISELDIFCVNGIVGNVNAQTYFQNLYMKLHIFDSHIFPVAFIVSDDFCTL